MNTDPETAAYEADRLAKHGGDGFKIGHREPVALRPTMVEQLRETVAAQAVSIASQSRLITEMSQDAIRGRKAADAMMLLGVKLGINPVPTDPEEFANAVMAAFDARTIKE